VFLEQQVSKPIAISLASVPVMGMVLINQISLPDFFSEAVLGVVRYGMCDLRLFFAIHACIRYQCHS
jgi:hypothetical protein